MPAPALGLAAAAALALAALLLDTRRTIALAVSLAAAGWWWGSVRLDALDRSELVGKAGRSALARVEVTGPARRGEFTVSVPVRVRRFGDDRPGERSRLELPAAGRAPPQGAVIDVVAKVGLPERAETEGAFDEATYLRRQGIHVVLRASRFRQVDRRGGVGGLADRLRGAIASSLAPGVTGERRALIAGVVLGEDEGLSSELRDDFRASGLYHLLAVSGQNVAYVVLGTLLLAWVAGLPRWLGQTSALVSLGAYVLAVGWQPSVVRAGVAGALTSLAWLAARSADRWYFLFAGAAVLLAVNPYALLEPGFQLSFAAVAAIFLLVPRLERRLEGYPVPTRLAGVVAVSLACGVATAPILWLHFGAVPVFSVVSNALAAPVVAPLLGMGLGAVALEPLVPTAAAALAALNGWLAAYLGWCARTVADLPHAQVTSPRALAALALVGLVLVGAFRLRPPRAERVLVLGATAVALVVGWWLWFGGEDAPGPPAGLRMTFLDVGQGDAILLETRQGAVLVDQGPPEGEVHEQLADLGVARLAALVLTHPQRDHVGGAQAVLERLPVDFLLDPRLPAESEDERAALAEARARDVPVVTARAGRTYRLGRPRLQVLWPEGPGAPGADPNESATVILASYGETDALLTADAESNVTLPLRPPPVEILKVAHHGSADEGLPALLNLVRPRVAVVSVGAGNDYGHPAPSTVSALRTFPSLDVYRTDRDGSVVVESDGSRLAVSEER
ncbi:MAG: DNA internalization-related competence protein ComEC/Rec2 [Actinomycetota bacterium]|nr:DNA internalization-related competence protein ComEC/Rec2 [Actinomycetota bacterium]